MAPPNVLQDDPASPKSPRLAPHLPLAKRVYYFLSAWSLKLVARSISAIIRFRWPLSPLQQPTIIRTYLCHPLIQTRIFIPPSHVSSALPLYISLHGSGFVLNDASMDDEYASSLATRYGVLVVSINYSKAPQMRFPGQPRQVAEIAAAIIDDAGLPVDKTRVVLGGFSAGGNLALAAAQMPVLIGRLRGVVAWYPPVDLSIPTAEKEASRPYREGEKDGLARSAGMFDWAYIPAGQDLRDPLLSPGYVRREVLPKWVAVVGAEYDMLCDEARRFMESLRGRTTEEEERYGWVDGGLKWRMVREVKHAFTHWMFERGEVEMERKRVYEGVFVEVAEWLMKGPLGKEA